jgi:uncharacterized membrane protein
MAALFPKKEGMDGIEKIALSFGMSLAVTALIGLGLNYTPWGIRLESVLTSIVIFIIIFANAALFRKSALDKSFRLTSEVTLRFPGWSGTRTEKSMVAALAIAIIAAIGVLIYVIAVPRMGEQFSEFYILGGNGKAENYPSEFYLTGGQVAAVSYDSASTPTAANNGEVTLGIVNREQQQTVYTVKMSINGQPADIFYSGNRAARLGPIELAPDGKFEEKIGFTPQTIGEKQKVEFFLYKDGSDVPGNTLHLWINVKPSP